MVRSEHHKPLFWRGVNKIHEPAYQGIYHGDAAVVVTEERGTKGRIGEGELGIGAGEIGDEFACSADVIEVVGRDWGPVGGEVDIFHDVIGNVHGSVASSEADSVKGGLSFSFVSLHLEEYAVHGDPVRVITYGLENRTKVYVTWGMGDTLCVRVEILS